MLIINIILAIYFSLIVYHIVNNVNIIEGLDDDDDDEYIPPPKDSTEYTAAEVAAQLDILKKQATKYKKQMKQLALMNVKMQANTIAIINFQKALAKIEEESQEFLDSR